MSNDIAVSNISVSRKQATFKLKRFQNPELSRGVATNLYLKDDDSRFGSFVQMPENGVAIKDYDPLPLTIERKCFMISVKPRFTKWANFINNSCCKLFPPPEKTELEDHLDQVWHALPEPFLHLIYPEFATIYSKYLLERKKETRIIRAIQRHTRKEENRY